MAMDLGLANYFLIGCFSWLVFYTVSIFVLVLCIHINALLVYIYFRLADTSLPNHALGLSQKMELRRNKSNANVETLDA